MILDVFFRSLRPYCWISWFDKFVLPLLPRCSSSLEGDCLSLNYEDITIEYRESTLFTYALGVVCS